MTVNEARARVEQALKRYTDCFDGERGPSRSRLYAALLAAVDAYGEAAAHAENHSVDHRCEWREASATLADSVRKQDARLRSDIEAAKAIEREACAGICDTVRVLEFSKNMNDNGRIASKIAAAIRGSR